MAKDNKSKFVLSITESPSRFQDLEKMPVMELITSINKEDARVHIAVRKTLPMIEKLVTCIIERMKKGGRVFYLGAGTSGRLGVLDASELPPTFGVPDNLVIGMIAGGDVALRKAVENAEDNTDRAWEELLAHKINTNDTVIGIAASGTTPYVIGGIEKARAIDEAEGLVLRLGTRWFNLANSWKALGNPLKAGECLLLAEKYSRQTGQLPMLTKVHAGLGQH